MRWLFFLALVTVVWFLAHASEGARKLMDNHRRGAPPGTAASFSVMPGMIVMPIASLGVAVVADHFVSHWGIRVVAILHLVWGVYLFGYIALTVIRLRRFASRA
jgi:hypothetical protein